MQTLLPVLSSITADTEKEERAYAALKHFSAKKSKYKKIINFRIFFLNIKR